MNAHAEDLTSRKDIERLIDSFYLRIRADERLGVIFDRIARVDWDRHLPTMYDFWESVLFGTGTYQGNPMAVHQALAQRTPMTAREFNRWVELFHQTVDDLFDGPQALETKRRASRIAALMQERLNQDHRRPALLA
jgi:hemoglobin